jgi:hypothetical protein
VSDPVSWYLIERGWRVVAAGGERLGHVTALDAEPARDIFDGIEFRHAVLEHVRYVPSEHVEQIVDGAVTLSLTAEQAESLGPRHSP